MYTLATLQTAVNLLTSIEQKASASAVAPPPVLSQMDVLVQSMQAHVKAISEKTDFPKAV